MNKSVVLDAKDFKLELSAKIYKKDSLVDLHLILHSDDFAGSVDMDVSADDLALFVKQIHAMNKKLKGSAMLKEVYGNVYGESFINMEMDKTGHINVSGYLKSFYHTMRFTNKFELVYLDMFDKALADTENWQEIC